MEKSVQVKGEKSQSDILSHASLKVVIDEQQSNNIEYAYPTMVAAKEFIAKGGACVKETQPTKPKFLLS